MKEVEFWFLIIFGTLSLIAFLVISYIITWGSPTVLFPMAMTYALYPILKTYIKGIIKLDSSNFPEIPLKL